MKFEHPNHPEISSVHETRPARDHEVPNWRRIDVAISRLGDQIADGIATATAEYRIINEETARLIANALGRGIGRDSALSTYFRTGRADFESIREEYLSLYSDPKSPPEIRDLIEKLGIHIINKIHEYPYMSEPLNSPKARLDQILVPTEVQINEHEESRVLIHVPGTYNASAITNLMGGLRALNLHEGPAVEAYLSLPDVDATSPSLVDDFKMSYVNEYRDIRSAVAALCDLDGRKREVAEYAADRRLYINELIPDFEELRDDVEDGYDLVEKEQRVYVFSR